MNELTDAAYHIQQAVALLKKAQEGAENPLEIWAIGRVIDPVVQVFNDVDMLAMSVSSTREGNK